ncbi:hypothetical protein [Christiangramia forsetii]|uniref:Uncharacterized protein n=2 Tax=Christiangramia forsetii TaxID=411153 RepID=A0LYM3_CHRFK|nr:hypothetical protein [Christiangramia forsetii]GGG33829.1 hypothetical protein GCM10011532_16890 [Christiangramia forsetii]CAL65468.1 hypothetical protein GFO_0485 [Christiangramia forsetii KT0803]
MKYFSESAEHPRQALYTKAREIMQISKHISDYLVPDLAVLNENGNEDKSVYFTGDIIRYSNSLIPNITKAENEFFQEARTQYIIAVGRLTDRLSMNCEKLEFTNSNGREFVGLLRREIKKFRKLQQVWRLTL